MNNSKHVIIVGAGPAGLYCAYELLRRGHKVTIFDQQSAVGKKFLVAGNGGLNLTHSESMDLFVQKYGENEEIFKELLASFSPQDLRNWCADIGVETFIGTSGRVFPKSFKAADILRRWQQGLKNSPHFELKLKHRLVEIDLEKKELSFNFEGESVFVTADRVVLALGGASWKRTGSDGKWATLFDESSIELAPFEPMNCGFEHEWSDFFKTKVERSEIKNISVSFGGREVRGEIMLTPFGIEGGAIYALSLEIRREIRERGRSIVQIDLKPDISLEEVQKRIELILTQKKKSLSALLKSKLNLPAVCFTLLREVLSEEEMKSPVVMAKTIKSLPVDFHAPGPIDEAISTSGGVRFCDLSKELEFKKYSDVFVIGEMLDFEAPTGGYLLQGCFATAHQVALAIDQSARD